MSKAGLLEREMLIAWDSWLNFLIYRTPEAWREYAASYRRARMVANNLEPGFNLPKPLIRVRANKHPPFF